MIKNIYNWNHLGIFEHGYIFMISWMLELKFFQFFNKFNFISKLNSWWSFDGGGLISRDSKGKCSKNQFSIYAIKLYFTNF